MTHVKRPPVGRRDVLRGLGAAAVLGGAAGTASAAGDDKREAFEDWFSNVDNYDGVADRTGESRVVVEVGAEGNGGGYAFAPAAVRVDPGTTVVWEWTGGDARHNVVAADGSYASDAFSEAGSTFALAFDGNGISKYVCEGHEAMRGAIVVGDSGEEVTSLTPFGAVFGGGLAASVLGFLGYGLYVHYRDTTDQVRVANA